MASTLPRIAITAGEPAGIGPELIAELAATDLAADLVAIGDPALIEAAGRQRGVAVRVEPYDAAVTLTHRASGSLRCLPIALAAPVEPGRLELRNARHVVDMLARASDGALRGEFGAIVTAPVQKSVLMDAGFAFVGHTEFFAERAHCDVVMLLVAPGLRVALATTHLPLAAVPGAIDAAQLTRTLDILDTDLTRRFRLAQPRVCVLGLNPHAGEGGHLGREEIEIITPVVRAAQARGRLVDGPLPADTAFVPTLRARYDAYLAMYHDQGLPVLKSLGFGDSVNVTLGLPYVRTSVDHGTALDLAGSGRADPASLIAATRMALDMLGP